MDNKEALKAAVQGFTSKIGEAAKGKDASASIKSAVQEMMDEIKKLYPVPEVPKKS